MHFINAFVEWFNETREAFNPRPVIYAVIAMVVTTAVFYVAFRLWRGLTNKAVSKVEEARETRLKPLRLQKLDILSADNLASLLTDGIRIIYRLVVALFAIVYINLVLGYFPTTRGVASRLFEVVKTSLVTAGKHFIDYLPNLAVIILTIAVAYYLVRFARLFFRGLATRRITISGFYPEWAMPTYGLVRLLIIAVAFVLILPNLPAAQSPAFRGVSIFIGVLISLGSTAAVANMVAGVVLTYTRAFKVGDRVRIADTIGDVREKSLFVTRITTPKNVETAIPNAMVLANHIINFSSLARREPGLILHTTVTIGYDVPREQVEKLLVEAALATEDLVDEPEPFLLITSLDDFSVSYEINAYTRGARWMASTYSELHGNILDRFNEAGVEIMSPHYTALRDGNAVAIPDDHLPKDYQPAPFRIHPFEGLFKKR